MALNLSNPDLSAPEFKREQENPTRARSVRTVKSVDQDRNAMVKICIITESRPWSHDGGPQNPSRALSHGEVVEVPEWLADFMIANKHAARV